MEDAKLQAIFDHVVGRDVVRKLMQVRLMMNSQDDDDDDVSGE